MIVRVDESLRCKMSRELLSKLHPDGTVEALFVRSTAE